MNLHSPKGTWANPATVAAAIRMNGAAAVRASGVPADMVRRANVMLAAEAGSRAERLDRSHASAVGWLRRQAVKRAARFGPACLNAMAARPYWLRFGAALTDLFDFESPVIGERLRRVGSAYGADVAERIAGLDGAARTAMALKQGLDLAKLKSVNDTISCAQLLRPQERVIRRTCRLFGVTRMDLYSARRGRELATARQFAMHWIKRLTPLSYPQIGRMFGGRDHTTALHAVRAWPGKRDRARAMIAAAREGREGKGKR